LILATIEFDDMKSTMWMSWFKVCKLTPPNFHAFEICFILTFSFAFILIWHSDQ
jgi:hypothetical protein